MDYFIVEGKNALHGEVSVMAAKNAVLPMLAASILAPNGTTVVKNVPDIADVQTMLRLLRHLGAEAEYCPISKEAFVDTSTINLCEAPYDIVRKMRASFLVLGPLLARFGMAKVSQPGGCSIGARPIDQHIMGLQMLGAEISDVHGYMVAKANKLVGRQIFFDRPSHTGTENILMASVLASGKTTIINAAQDPEVVDFANFLCKMGAKITGAGTSIIDVEGVSSLSAIEYKPIGDRLEAGTYLHACVAAGGNIAVKGVDENHLSIVLLKLELMGAKLTTSDNSISIIAPERPKAIDIITDPYPGFPTDLQPMAMATLCRASGTSVVWERIFENRFMHIMEFRRLGANITILGDKATVVGVEELDGADVMASDIRAGAGLLIAALSARGKTNINRVYHIDRGYYRIEEKLSSLGAKISRKSR